MNNLDNEKGCRQDPGCCNTGGAPAPKDRRGLILRILISVGVLLIAAGVTAYVLLTRYPAQVATPACATQTAPAINPSAISDLNWVKQVYANQSNSTYTFALLPGEDRDKSAAVLEAVKNVIAQLNRPGINVSFLVLERSDPEFSATAEKLLIGETPAIIGLNSVGNIAILKGDITFEKLYETYSISSSSCFPPAGGTCGGCN
jgi:uncharacterized protein (UPF0333 family)